MSVALYLVHREEALKKGYTTEDFSVYLDFLSSWLGTLGVNDFSYGSLGEVGEKRPQFKDCIVAYVESSKEANEELQSFLASMSMTQDMGNWGPYALQNLDFKVMKMVLVAWRFRNDHHRAKLTKVASAAANVMREAHPQHPWE